MPDFKKVISPTLKDNFYLIVTALAISIIIAAAFKFIGYDTLSKIFVALFVFLYFFDRYKEKWKNKE